MTSRVRDLIGLVEVIDVPRELIVGLVLFLDHSLLCKESLMATLLGRLLTLCCPNFIAFLVLVFERPFSSFFFWFFLGNFFTEARSVLVGLL